MVQSQTAQRNALNELGYKIFLDRYAQKDMTRSTLAVGDTVIVVVDSKTGQREIGKIATLNLPKVTVQLLDGETVERDLEHVDKPLETDPGQMMDRVAAGIAAIETTPELQQTWTERFRWLLDDWKFVPGGRILTAAGTDQQLSYYNCYVLDLPRDSRGGILKTLGEMTEIMSRGGGVGITLSSLRPRHAYVKGVNGRSSGAVSWGALYSFVTGLIEQGGSRRGALLLLLADWHPDVIEFIISKRKSGNITNANISVAISDKFMQAVKEDGDWHLRFPDTSEPEYDTVWDGDIDKWEAAGHKVHIYRTLKARELWQTIIQSAWASAEPGLLFLERINKMANSWYFAPLIGVNPCGEEPLPGNGVCNLGAINLSKFYDEEHHDVAWDDLRETVRYGVRFLDNVVDVNPYFFEKTARQQLNERRVGLGTMGLAELMIRLGIRYGSDESLNFLDRLYGFITTEAYLMSAEIAAEKGAFPQFNAKKFLQSGFMKAMPEHVRKAVRQKGIRNVTLVTVAPTGTTGTLVNTSTGVEPFFSWSYYRKSRLGVHEEQVLLVKRWFEQHPGETELPDYFVTAMDLPPEDHVRVQGAVQRWIDSSISKTANLPNHYTVEQTRALYELMYDLGCKGGTVYRDGSRDEQVLTLKTDDDKKAAEPSANGKAPAEKGKTVEQVATPHRIYPRPRQLAGVTVSRKTPFGTAFITMNSDEYGNPFEVFITVGKAGSDLQADAEGLGRMISLQLRTTAPQNRKEMLKLVVDQLQGIGGSRAVGLGPMRVLSLPDAVAGALLEHYFPPIPEEQLKLPMINGGTHADSADHSEASANGVPVHGIISGADICPECGLATLVRAEGCEKCLSCEYSRC